MQTKRRLLVVLAHPDDESFLCGGTIAKMSERGIQITLLCATKGEMGRRMGNPILTTRESLPGLRVRELKGACEELGIKDLRFLQFVVAQVWLVERFTERDAQRLDRLGRDLPAERGEICHALLVRSGGDILP